MRLDPYSFAMAALLTSLVAVAPISTDMYLPALPAIGEAFGADTAAVQLTLSVYMAGFAVAQLILGPLSDRLGRRPVLIGGIAVFFVASLTCVLVETIEGLIAARLFQAVGACAGGAVGRAVVRDIHETKNAARLLAHMGSAMALAPLVAPLIGGQLTAHFSWHANFYALAAVGLFLLIVTVLFLPESHANPDVNALNPRRMVSNYKTLLRSSDFRDFTLTNAFSFSGLFAFISGSSFVFIEHLGMGPETFGFAFGAVVLGYMAGTQLSARFLKTQSVEHLVWVGGTIGLLASLTGVTLAATLPTTVFTIVVPMFFYTVSVGFVMPNSMAGSISPFPHMAGAASALMGFLQMALASLMGVMVGVLYDGTALPMTAVIATSGLIAWLFARRVHKKISA